MAVEKNQVDTFQDSTTQAWGSGAPNPNTPTVVLNDGPSGTNDIYLMATSSGNTGAGSKLVIFNNSQWTGDYISAGVNAISMYVNNFGSTDLSLRIALRGSGGDFWSKDPVSVNAGSGWQIAVFEIDSMHLAGSGTSVSATLRNVNEIRILHSATGDYKGDAVTASLGIDNITAANNPLPVELTLFTGYQNNADVILKWTTQSELNNLGFEIQKRNFNANSEWKKIGFVNGKGNSNFTEDYTFVEKNKISSIAYYKLKQIDFDGSFTFSNEIKVEFNLPDKFSLKQNYPNPFNPTTKIRYSIPASLNSFKEGTLTQLKVYDILGNEISTLVNKEQQPGNYEATFNGNGLASGIYFYQLTIGNLTQTRKMNLMK